MLLPCVIHDLPPTEIIRSGLAFATLPKKGQQCVCLAGSGGHGGHGDDDDKDVEESHPSLKRIHLDATITSGSNRFSYDFWRQQATDDIVQSLRPGADEALRSKPDGRIIKVTQESSLGGRGFDVNAFWEGYPIMALEWSKELDRFRKMTQEQQLVWCSQLLFLLSMFPDTYEVGTDGVSRELRRFNEVLHRLASQQLKIAKADTARIPDDQMFQFLEEEASALAVDTRFAAQTTVVSPPAPPNAAQGHPHPNQTAAPTQIGEGNQTQAQGARGPPSPSPGPPSSAGGSRARTRGGGIIPHRGGPPRGAGELLNGHEKAASPCVKFGLPAFASNSSCEN